MNSVLWRPVPLSVRIDPVLGGRWTSLRSFEREWLWTNPDPEIGSARRWVSSRCRVRGRRRRGGMLSNYPGETGPR
jgi:hypothetical protein